MKISWTAIAFALMLVAQTAFAEPAVTIRAVDLKAKPASDAKVVKSLPAESTVDVVSRQGAWVHLKSGNASGWAKLFDIRSPQSAAAPSKSGSNGIADTLGLAMGTRGSSVTTGVRGLDADMLAQATPNAQEFALLTRYARSAAQAKAFARVGHLHTREVAELPAAPATAAPGAAQ